MIVKELLQKILSENSWGLYTKERPLEELPSNVGKMWKKNEVDLDQLVFEYNKVTDNNTNIEYRRRK